LKDGSGNDKVLRRAVKNGMETDRPDKIPGGELRLLAKRLKWGTLGVHGKGPVRWVPISDLNVRHLRSILITQPRVTALTKAVMISVFAKKVVLAVTGKHSGAEEEYLVDECAQEISKEEALVNAMMGDDDA
jgi:cytochrome b